MSWDVLHPTQASAWDEPLSDNTPIPQHADDTKPAEVKKKVDWSDYSSPWLDNGLSIEQGRDDSNGLEPSFGFQTPFRTGRQFLEQPNNSNSTVFFSTPSYNTNPDMTVGLATPSRTNLGDNVREESQGRSVSVVQNRPPVSSVILNQASHVRSNPVSSTLTVPYANKSNPNSAGESPPFQGGPSDSNSGGGFPYRGNGNHGGGGGGFPPSGGGGGGGGGFPPAGNSNSGNGGSGPPSGPSFQGGPFPPGGGGGGNDPPGPGGVGWPQAPYGNMPASIKTELKVEQLPEWDGNHWTAIDYFWNVQQLAYLGGWLPEALGYWLWFRLKEKSTVKTWFVTLPVTHQSYMRTHYLRFLKGIKDGFLGSRWQLKMNNYYNAQTFRERGHEREMPTEFIVRRIVYTRMLLSIDPGGPLEVFYIMRKAPISWGPILLLSNIKDSSELYSRVTEHEEALLEAYRVSKGGSALSLDSIVAHLKQMGMVNDRPFIQRRANLTENDQEMAPISRPVDQSIDNSSDQHILHEAYQVLQQRQRPPPKGGYQFSRNNHVTTEMGKLPLSPCKVCGSANHWDKECPDWNTYLERVRRSANLSEASSDTEGDKAYATAYSILLNERLANDVVNQSDLNAALERQGFEMASIPSRVIGNEESKPEGVKSSCVGHSQRVSLEEIKDEYWKTYEAKPKSVHHILEEVVFEKEASHASNSPGVEPNFRSPSSEPQSSTPPISEEMPVPDRRIKLKKRCFMPAGASAVGVSVVAVQGHVGSTRNTPIDLRLDSCADVTLISQEYLESLKDRPACQKGIKMNLWQLTDKDSEIQGYVRIPIIMTSTEGILIETEAEAYIVPNMTVPILLGEDYHLNYELIVAHCVDFCSTINFTGTPYTISARGVSRTKDFNRMRQSACAVGSFVKSKLHKHNKAKKARQRKKFGLDKRTIRASQDYRLHPEECRRIKVEGHFDEDRTWLVEKNLLASANDSSFLVPNMLISSSDPWVPVSNPSTHPQTIRKGDVIGYLVDPQEFFDAPHSEEKLGQLRKSAEAVASMIAIAADSKESARDEPTSSIPTKSESTQEGTSDPEQFGPKTAELPDMTTYSSHKMEEYPDIGSLPENLKEKAWNMLRKRQKAFGFDGRLGQHPAKVHIRTEEGQVPIATPMYGSSPAKRAIIDEQIDKWFEQDVIEPSRSPWSAPVVIAYRNGKPRFCVDYRKLNAATIPDEFPIPRQTEILSSLSGAQVLSSLDALSGFTQLEMSQEDVEKTAF